MANQVKRQQLREQQRNRIHSCSVSFGLVDTQLCGVAVHHKPAQETSVPLSDWTSSVCCLRSSWSFTAAVPVPLVPGEGDLQDK